MSTPTPPSPAAMRAVRALLPILPTHFAVNEPLLEEMARKVDEATGLPELARCLIDSTDGLANLWVMYGKLKPEDNSTVVAARAALARYEGRTP